MNPLKILIFVMIFSFACTFPKMEPAPGKTDTMAPASPIVLSYKMRHSDWRLGDPNHTKLVLDMYRAWEDNRLDEAAKAFGDVTIYENANGSRDTMTKQTILDSFGVWRGAIPLMSFDVITALPFHSNESNEDWVSVWVKTKWTDTDGKIDSILANNNYTIKNGKIVHGWFLEQRAIKTE